MHSIVLLTALTAASGLFGGGRQCARGQCGPAVRSYPTAAPAFYAPPAPVPHAPAPRAVYYQSYYPTVATCPGGTCPRR